MIFPVNDGNQSITGGRELSAVFVAMTRSCFWLPPRDSLILKNQEDTPITGDVPHKIPHTRKYLII
jgi:hypothetical protein